MFVSLPIVKLDFCGLYHSAYIINDFASLSQDMP